MRKDYHGMVGTKPYNAWSNMKRRCDDPKNKEYANYGGRGITYCESWSKFINFWNDMKEGYANNLTLDRKEKKSIRGIFRAKRLFFYCPKKEVIICLIFILL